MIENSYMLPQGARMTERPRKSRPPASRKVPSHVIDIAMLAERRPGGRAPSSGPPTATSVLVATATEPSPAVAAAPPAVAGTRSRPLVAAKETAKVNIAIV